MHHDWPSQQAGGILHGVMRDPITPDHVAATGGGSKRSLTSPIKWPGGKAAEFQYIQHLLPPYRRYVEPFFGGGAIYFLLQPKAALINDFSADLMDFYRFLNSDYDTAAFAEALYAYVDNWEKIPGYVAMFTDELVAIYQEIAKQRPATAELSARLTTLLKTQERHFNGLFLPQFCVNTANLELQIVANITSKLLRTAVIEKRHAPLSTADLYKNIETAFRSGFYMHFRDLLNHKLGPVPAATYSANYYFIREFCYGAMFRYNNQGHFNIPYGGIAYNSKDFRRKVDYILSPAVRQALSGATIETGDFEAALRKHHVGKGDFVFLDPPYDSDFSSYDNNGFGAADHERLAAFVQSTKAKCMLLISETPFIRSLYADKPGISIESFDKTYLYNVKGRNNQKANHLVIYNYHL